LPLAVSGRTALPGGKTHREPPETGENVAAVELPQPDFTG